LPGPAPTPVSRSFSDTFDKDKLDLKWSFLRNPRRENYVLENGILTLNGTEVGLSTPNGHPTMIAVRQEEFNMDFTVRLEGEIQDGQCSGITAFYNNVYHYDIFVTKSQGSHMVCLRKRVADIEVTVAACPIDYNGEIYLKIVSDDEWYSFFYEINGELVELGKGVTSLLCTETNGRSFTGTFFGVFSEQGKIGVKCVTARELLNK
jgi:alpha-N-arabinofuranosidase